MPVRESQPLPGPADLSHRKTTVPAPPALRSRLTDYRIREEVPVIASVNPSTGVLVKGFDPHSHEECDRILDAVAGAGRRWASEHISDRAEALRAIGRELM